RLRPRHATGLPQATRLHVLGVAVLGERAPYPPTWLPKATQLQVLIPRIRRVRDGVRDAALVAAEAERLEPALPAAEDVVRDELAEPDHLEPVVRVHDHVGVRQGEVDDRVVVRRERADPAVWVGVPLVALAAEALVRPREPRGEVVRELVADDVIRIPVPVRLQLDLRAEPDGDAAALDAVAAAPDLVVDATRSVLDHAAVAVGPERDDVVEVH